ncbi:MAG TPA: redoxin family protein [Pirellulaceae bacterium]|nr:redoxin family protein [Pirellulaceae bacterium]
MRNIVLFGILLLFVFAAALAGGAYARRWQAATPNHVATQPVAQAQRGALLFQVHCAKCHGEEGRGEAEGSTKMVPPPRDFASRPWKFEPSEASIARVIREGSRGTAMPAFQASLASDDIAALTAHVLELAQPVEPAGGSDLFRAAGFAKLATPRAAPALRLQATGGKQLALSELRGRVVLLNFWGLGCPHCLIHMQELAELQANNAQAPLTIVNICADADDLTEAQAALTAAAPQASLMAYVDEQGLANAQYEVTLLPTIWLMDAEGRLLAKAQGAREWNDPALQALLKHCYQP